MSAAHWIRSAMLAAATSAAVAGVLAPAGVARAQPAADVGAEAVQRDLEQQELLLRSATSDPVRDEAARKLVSRDAEQVLLRLLLDGGSRNVQLAVARALALDPTPNEIFIAPLARLLGQDAALTDAAAQALATFKNNQVVLDRLTTFIQLENSPNRRSAVRALGKLVDKRAAQTLIGLLNAPDENTLVRDAAAGALEQMTGETFGTDPQRWNQWWAQARTWSDEEWALAIARVTAARANNVGARLQSVRESLYRRESVRYQQTSEKDPAAANADLLRLMSDPSEDVRTVAVQIVYDEAGLRVPPAAIAERLRNMVGDSSPLVRERVALTLGAINDQAAVDALLTQAAQERDRDVLAAIISALGPASQLRGDFRTVEALLLASLEHESFQVSRAAAESFKALARLLRDPTNQRAADTVATQLQERLRSTDRNVAALKLRESIVEALAELAHPSSRVIFQQLLNPGSENPNVRIWALRGLRNIGDPDTAQGIVNVLSNDPDRGVRFQAAEALLTTARYANIQQIYPRLNEATEPDDNVRAKVWEVMVGLFEQAEPGQLADWAEQFKKGPVKQSLERRLTVLLILEKKLVAAGNGDGSGANERNLAVQRQNLGDVLLDVNKPEEASIKFLQALAYWKAVDAPEYVKHGLVVQTMTALLQAKKDAEACAFATEAIAQNKQSEGDLWTQVKTEIERRQKNKDVQSALSLVRAARSVPWPDLRVGQLNALEKELQQMIDGAGAGASRIVHEPRIYEHAAVRTHAG